MSSSGQREMVFCHVCEDEWYRDQHGLTCPRCQSEFVEVIEANHDPRDTHDDHDEEEWSPAGSGAVPDIFNIGNTGSPFHPFAHTHPANRSGIGHTVQNIRTPSGGFTITSTRIQTLGSDRGSPRPVDPHADIMNTFGNLLQGLLGNAVARQGGALSPAGQASRFPYSPDARLSPRDANSPQRQPELVDDLPGIMAQFYPVQNSQRSPGPPGMQEDHMPPSPIMGMMRMIFAGHPMMGGNADGVYSQEEFDRIMSNLMEQAQSGGGAPPASQADIASIPKKRITADMLGENGKAECTICMDDVQLDQEVSEMYCSHWFHTHCIEAWVSEHDSCPHCRKTLQEGREEAKKSAKSSPRSPRGSSHREERRHSTRRASSARGGSSDSHNGGAAEAGGGGIRDRLSRMFGNSR